jgi:hypothetical protein
MRIRQEGQLVGSGALRGRHQQVAQRPGRRRQGVVKVGEGERSPVPRQVNLFPLQDSAEMVAQNR